MNYKKVIEDFNSGTLNKDIITLVMDNDGGYWSVSTGSEEVDEIIEERLEEAYGTPDGYKDIVDVLNAAGVNTEWC